GRLRTRLVLAQNPDDLLFRKPLPLHLSVLQSRPDSNSRWRKNSVAGHWQRDATRDLATGRTGDAISAYDRHDLVHEAQTRELARGDLIDRWDRDRQAAPDSSRIILTHTNAEVRELNEAARDRMREAGDLGEDMRVTVERGERSFAAGDRVMFLPDGTS